MHYPSLTIAYADWLGTMKWNFFCTFSTRYSMTVRAARRAMERLYSHLSKHYGKVRIFWVAEPFDTRHGYHTHALVHIEKRIGKNLDALLRKAWQIVSKGKGGKENNHTTIEKYQKKLGGRYYLSKYLNRKDCEYDINF